MLRTIISLFGRSYTANSANFSLSCDQDSVRFGTNDDHRLGFLELVGFEAVKPRILFDQNEDFVDGRLSVMGIVDPPISLVVEISMPSDLKYGSRGLELDKVARAHE